MSENELEKALESIKVQDVRFNQVKYGIEIIVTTESNGEIVFYQNPTDPIYDQLCEKELL